MWCVWCVWSRDRQVIGCARDDNVLRVCLGQPFAVVVVHEELALLGAHATHWQTLSLGHNDERDDGGGEADGDFGGDVCDVHVCVWPMPMHLNGAGGGLLELQLSAALEKRHRSEVPVLQ